MADFLLELLTEEIPARMQKSARGELEKLFVRELSAAGVSAGDITVWSTPRRLALIARDLPTETEAVHDEAKGPPVGAPDQAVDGFCRKNGVTRDQLETREVKGRATYFAVIEKPGQKVADLLATVIPYVITQFSWPKSMRWGAASITSESLRWVRPLSGIVALLDGDVIEFELPSHTDVYSDASGNLEFKKVDIGLSSGRTTMGHRFHSSGPISIDGADDYADKLRSAHVIVDHQERERLIREGAKTAAEEAGLVLVEDEGLVVENAGLTEWPVPLLGRFDEEFLDVPPEVIQLTARVNQKYFVCTRAPAQAGASSGSAQTAEVPAGAGTRELANAFICTANIEAADPAVVVDGNRKVLAARLADASFFWELDQKTSLVEHAQKLERITFHEKLGTVADKVDRVAKLARWLCEEGIVTPASPREGGDLPQSSTNPKEVPAFAGTREELANLAEQAARLCKADLVTEMVGEFPELQGLMGGYYAEKEGLAQEVSNAIRDHYKPVGQGDDVPTAPVTVAVSLADKLDTLIGFFAIDEKPTGSKDPFALRRACLAVISTLQANDIRIPLGVAAFVGMGPIVLRFVEKAATALAIGESQVELLEQMRGRSEKGGASESMVDDVFRIVRQSRAHKPQEAAEDLERLMRDRTPQDFSHEVVAFFADRLKVQQREAGVRHDLIDAVFALGGEDDLVRLLARVHALQSFIETDNGKNLLAGYKRAANILKKENYVTPAKAGVSSGSVQTPEMPASAGMTSLGHEPEPAEAALIEALDQAEPKAAAAIEAEDFEAAMEALATLRAPIDAFFEGVTVNDTDADKRNSRLALLGRLRDAVHTVADFSRIEG